VTGALRWIGALFPTPSLSKYLIKMFLLRFLAILALLICVLQLLDMLNKSDEILVADGATTRSLMRYVMLRAPQLISEFAPFAALLAALVSLAELSQSSEITVMRAAGLSAHRILFPLGLGCLAIAVAHFVFHETTAVPTTAKLAYWEANDFALEVTPPPAVRTDVWLDYGDDRIKVQSVGQPGARTVLEGVRIYHREPSGALAAITRAEFAWHDDGVWNLFEVRRFDMASGDVSTAPWQAWEVSIPPSRFFQGAIEPDQTGLMGIARAIKQRRLEGADTQALETAWLQRLAAPASNLLMPLMAAVAGFGVHRSGNLLARVALGMGLGFSFFVADKFMYVMGELGVAPPMFAAFAPIFFYLLLGFSTLFFVEEF